MSRCVRGVSVCIVALSKKPSHLVVGELNEQWCSPIHFPAESGVSPMSRCISRRSDRKELKGDQVKSSRKTSDRFVISMELAQDPSRRQQGHRPTVTSTPVSYQQFSFRERGQFEDAFQRMSLPLQLFAAQQQPVPATQQRQQNPNSSINNGTNDPSPSFDCAVITAEHLPHMTRLLNLSFSEVEIGAVAKRFGKSCETLQRKLAAMKAAKTSKTPPPNSARSAASETSPTSSPEHQVPATQPMAQASTTGSPLSDSTELLFDFETIVEIYNAYAPIQRDFETQYMQFFNLLDSDEQDLISVSDLRHALCNLGDALTDREFNHLLYANKLLHRTSISIFEFMSLLMGSVE